MAESKGALIAKSVQKHAGRAKEKLLQNLGKVDRTLDDIFEEHLQNFNRQHQQATRLQKEFNNYIRCIRAVQTASKSLMEAITEVYESSWSGHDLLYVQAQNMEMLWQDFSHKLGDQVLIPINTYTNQFPETRKKIEKRGRKLVDYDSQRHSFQNLQANAAKRRDDVKITKGREQLEEAKRTYEVLNSELHDELPALHDSRVLFYVHNLQTLFSSEQLFHAESAKVFAELEAITDKLATDSQRGGYRGKHAANGSATLQTPSPALNGDSPPDSPNTSNTPNTPNTPKTSKSPTPDAPARRDHSSPPDSPVKGGYSVNPVNSVNAVNTVNDVNSVNANTNANEDKKVEELYDIPVGAEIENVNNNVEEKRQVEDEKEKVVEKNETETPPKTDEVYDIPVGATLAPGALYRVRATYRYTREDSDELSFDVGDVIRVVEYDDPDEQEEGWLMGIKETTNEKGMFPANFTRPI